jgi:coenzyme F420-reducing hydrogenase alpha subunit
MGRLEKYDKKLSGDIYKNRTEELRKQQIAQYKASISKQIEIENFVKQVLQKYEEKAHMTNYYMIFAKQIYALTQKYKDQTLINEAKALDALWNSRGLREDILLYIKKYFIPNYQIISYFRLDVSRLDGPDVLG